MPLASFGVAHPQRQAAAVQLELDRLVVEPVDLDLGRTVEPDRGRADLPLEPAAGVGRQAVTAGERPVALRGDPLAARRDASARRCPRSATAGPTRAGGSPTASRPDRAAGSTTRWPGPAPASTPVRPTASTPAETSAPELRAPAWQRCRETIHREFLECPSAIRSSGRRYNASSRPAPPTALACADSVRAIPRRRSALSRHRPDASLGKQHAGEAELAEVADPHRIQRADQVVALVLHHAGMEAVGHALDRLALQIEAAVADARMARHHAAQAGHRQAALPVLLHLVGQRLDRPD